eukprot:TRINITY_DN46771_c0_g1_i1.p1 TRINITY_DN46771_c0_g1~~TRINITY_DN46771_c0_g1_i1.p1  ORF type:complete len:562 (+),score=188.92 TRINITY_DN46771_c0_g1_i1:59-1687(+)
MRAFGLLALAAPALGLGDLERARAKVPRQEYRADHSYRLGKRLNQHLAASHRNVKPCHKWTSAELQRLQATLLQHREPQHDVIYGRANDARALRFKSTAEFEAHWAHVGKAAGQHKQLTEMQRDGHCHEAVMWWVHHTTHGTRQKLAHVEVPTVPLVEWRRPTEEEGAAAQHVWESHYNPSSTCLACHGGGMPWQAPDTQPPPLPRQVNGNDRLRRCEEWYGDEEGGACTGCEGVAGAYWGDLPDECLYPSCEGILNASSVPVADRAPSRFPKAFAVEMRGADRWPRASASGNASCNYTTDCEPIGDAGVPLPPGGGFHWYSSIHGVLYLDHHAGLFGGGRLRHETVYQLPNGREGAERSLRHLNGHTNVHLTEIHIQTPEMGSTGNPGVMLNLEHTKMNQLNKSGVDDSKLDWRRIPATDGTCVCVSDPAGLPNFYGAFDNATYVGRVRMLPPWQKTGVGGPPDGKPVVADHWVKWVFHLWVDVETYMPIMFSSPYGGTATYGNWTIMPDAMWPEWRENPPACVDVKGDPNCAPWTPPPSP